MDFQVKRVGHVGIHVSDVDRSIEFYRRVLGLRLTGDWRPPEVARPICFMRCGEMHHDFVFMELSKDVDRSGLSTSDSDQRRDVGLHHIAFEIPTRQEWLAALAHVRKCGVELVSGPYVHGPEALGEGGFSGGSGSHAFYFLDPDGNRVEVYCWMMRVTAAGTAAPAPDLP